jgi:hypothetical protein
MHLFHNLSEPAVGLTHWAVYEVPLHGIDRQWSTHFVGFEQSSGLVQVTSQILQFIAEDAIGLSQTGKVFHLMGEPAVDTGPLGKWTQWKKLSGVKQERDITTSFYKALRAWSGAWI